MRWWTGSELITAETGTPASPAGSIWSGVRLPKRVVVPHSMYAVVAARPGRVDRRGGGPEGRVVPEHRGAAGGHHDEPEVVGRRQTEPGDRRVHRAGRGH